MNAAALWWSLGPSNPLPSGMRVRETTDEAIFLMWTKKPASVTSSKAARGRDGRRGLEKGHAARAMKKATWREKSRGRAAYFAFRSPAVASWNQGL